MGMLKITTLQGLSELPEGEKGAPELDAQLGWKLQWHIERHNRALSLDEKDDQKVELEEIEKLAQSSKVFGVIVKTMKEIPSAHKCTTEIISKLRLIAPKSAARNMRKWASKYRISEGSSANHDEVLRQQRTPSVTNVVFPPNAAAPVFLLLNMYEFWVLCEGRWFHEVSPYMEVMILFRQQMCLEDRFQFGMHILENTNRKVPLALILATLWYASLITDQIWREAGFQILPDHCITYSNDQTSSQIGVQVILNAIKGACTGISQSQDAMSLDAGINYEKCGITFRSGKHRVAFTAFGFAAFCSDYAQALKRIVIAEMNAGSSPEVRQEIESEGVSVFEADAESHGLLVEGPGSQA